MSCWKSSRVTAAWTFTLLVGMSAPVVAEDAMRLDARYWFNNPVFRLHDDRAVVLFLFEVRERDRSTLEAVRALNRVAARPDTVVIGLTPDGRQEVETFIRRHRVRFTVGAGSRNARALAGGELPALLRVDRENGAARAPEPLDWTDLDEYALRLAELTPADLNQLAEPWQLMEVISSDARFGVRRAAVKRLYESVDPERFIEYAHDRLPAERNPWVRSNLEYYRDLALGTPRDDAQRTPSSQAEFEYRQNPTAPEWAAVAKFREQISESATAATMLTALRTHLSNAPADLVIRRIAATELTEVAEEERAVVRDELLELLPHETDPSVRMYMAFALAFAAETGDAEVVGLLRSLAAVEPNILLVRPELEYLAWSIETGDEDPEHMTR